MEIDLWPSTETNNILGCSEVFHTFLFRGITASQLAHITENKKARYLSSWCFKSLFSFPDPISALVLDPNSRMHPLRKKVVTASVNYDFLRGQFNSFISLGIYKRSPMSQTLCRAGGGAWGIRSLLFYIEGLNLSRGTDMAKKQEDCNACGIGTGREQKGQSWSRRHLSRTLVERYDARRQTRVLISCKCTLISCFLPIPSLLFHLWSSSFSNNNDAV